jgi:hypothetical protein
VEFGIWEWVLMNEVSSRMIHPVFDLCKMTEGGCEWMRAVLERENVTCGLRSYEHVAIAKLALISRHNGT